jgi:hypothetical protein
VWDFKAEKIIVLDPTMNNGEESDKVIQSRHTAVAEELHAAIARCICTFFPGWNPNLKEWRPFFPKGLTTAVVERYMV